MKKILLSLMLVGAFAVGKAQVVFNEFYPNPKDASKDEYLELYNTSGAGVNLDCWSILSYDQANHRGYIYQLPNVLIPSGGFLALTGNTSATPPVIRYSQPAVTYSGSNIKSWNQPDATASLTLLTKTGSALVASPAVIPVTDFLLDPSGGSGIALFLFNGNTLVNAFIGSGSPALPTDFASITTPFNMSSLTGSCAGAGSVTFSGITTTQAELQAVVSATGADNGYYRTTNGLCGTWEKSSATKEQSPGTSNGGTGATAFANVTQSSSCSITGNGQVTWNIGIQILNSIYNPSNYVIYEDKNNNHVIDFGIDDRKDTGTINVTTQVNLPPYVLPGSHDIMIRVTAQQNCVIIFRNFRINCINLPVKFKSFAAARNHSNVDLKWETAFEQNNSGFSVERNIRGTWEQVAFVPTQAANGNSNSPLTYQLADLNNIKGMSQYRIRQIDFDAKSSYSEIRAVRGEGQSGKTVVFPNPSQDGRVSVVFEDATVTRDATLSDMSGRTLKTWKGVTNNNIQIENLTPGMYSLRIVVPETGEQSVEKIIVSKR